MSLQVIFFLSEGVGLSFVNSVPEEVLYISLSGFEVQYLDTRQEMSLKVEIKKIQVKIITCSINTCLIHS